MYILGISCYYHDAAACLVKDGIIIAAAEEERFTRKKHDASFPIHAIRYCLQEAGITPQQLDHVAFYEKPLLKFDRILHQHLQCFPRSYWSFFKALPPLINEKLRIGKKIKKELGFKKDIVYAEHHMSHAASTFLVSPFKKAAILTVDGVGEWATTTFGVGEGSHITLLKEIRFPHSLGLLYSTITAYLGFSVNNSEYKVMGLSPYGKPTYYDQFMQLIDVKDDGSYALDMSYFLFHHAMRMPSPKLIQLLGPARDPEGLLDQRHKDIAASLQKVTEDVLFSMLRALHKETKLPNVCLAGGVALNSVANGKILRETPFKKIFIQPAAGDAGGAVGVALYTSTAVAGFSRNYVWHTNYLGPGYSDREIRDYLEKAHIVYVPFVDDSDLVSSTAQLLYKNHVVGWFQGRMEWGPRALGARSILSNACNPEMQDILNLKVKHREKFRPFAPVVCEDDASTYFDCDVPVPLPTDYMLMVYPVKKQWHTKIPAVTHVDGSGRLQTIRREQNSLYYDVIKAFGKLSHIPILINTSFNIRGEPIVCTPHDAYRCMMGTGIDYLVIGNYLVKRDDNPRDMWDSESIAKD